MIRLLLKPQQRRVYRPFIQFQNVFAQLFNAPGDAKPVQCPRAWSVFNTRRSRVPGKTADFRASEPFPLDIAKKMVPFLCYQSAKQIL